MTNIVELGQYAKFLFPTHEIARLNKIGEFGVTRDDIDVTAHDSSGNADDWMAGQIHGGELTVSGFLTTGDTSGQMAAITDCLAGTKRIGTIQLPNVAKSTWTAMMYCKSYKIDSDLKGPLGIAMVFKVSGQPVWTAST
jgi:hypothetical protein